MNSDLMKILLDNERAESELRDVEDAKIKMFLAANQIYVDGQAPRSKMLKIMRENGIISDIEFLYYFERCHSQQILTSDSPMADVGPVPSTLTDELL